MVSQRAAGDFGRAVFWSQVWAIVVGDIGVPSPELLDFGYGYPDDTKVGVVANVVQGMVYIEGSIRVNQLEVVAAAVRSTLAAFCDIKTPVLTRVYQEIETYGQPRINLQIRWNLLPAAGTLDACLHQLEASKSGSFPKLLDWNLRLQQSTGGLGASDWDLRIDSPLVMPVRVLLPTQLLPPPATGVPGSGGGGGNVMPGSGGGTGSTTPRTGNTNSSSPASLADCEYAVSGCICAAGLNCAWIPRSSGGFRCASSIVATAVSCEYCPIQQQCPMTQSEACSSQGDACACSNSNRDCRWNQDTFDCVPRNGGQTSCSICSRQPHCDPPKVLGVTPKRGSLLGSALAKDITVTFDRSVQYSGTPGDVTLNCRGSPTLKVIPPSMLNVTGTALSIDVSGVRNEAVSECDLEIAEGVVRDSAWVRFLGMMMGQYSFRLSDTVAPRVLDFNPGNGATGVDPGAIVTLTFSEPVVPSLASSIALIMIWTGAAQGASGGDTSRVVFEFSLSSDVRASADQRQLSVDLGRHAVLGATYSLKLPKGCVTDDAQNAFEGLAEGVYMFAMKPVTWSRPEATVISVVVIGAIAGVGALACLMICLVLCVCFCRVHRAGQQLESQLHQDARGGMRMGSIWSNKSGASVGRLWSKFRRSDTRAFSVDKYAIGPEASVSSSQGSQGPRRAARGAPHPPPVKAW